jgi:hypothetical protein
MRARPGQRGAEPIALQGFFALLHPAPLMTAVRIAILDEQLTAQLSERPGALEGVDVVWRGTDLPAFRAEVPAQSPDAIAVDLGLLGPEAAKEAQQLLDETGAQLALVLYTFARRELIGELAHTQARPLRSPLSLDSLRGILSGLMVRKILAEGSSSRARTRAAASARGKDETAAPAASVTPRYSRSQLGRLKEIQSAIECECPANVADLLTQLVAFEEYSAQCANKNDADARIHRMLFEETGRARKIMEDALAKLLQHESIDI